MAKKINNKPVTPVAKPVQTPVADLMSFVKDPKIPAWLYDFRFQAIVVALLAFGFYINSFNNEFAHDDSIVIIKNEYVLEGFAPAYRI